MQTKSKSAPQVRILYSENDSAALSSQAPMFENAGYAVQKAIGRKSTEETLKREKFDIVILGHTLTRDDRHHLPYMAKKADEGTLVLVLHASGKHPQVDAAIDSRDGFHRVLELLADLTGQKLAPAAYQTATPAARGRAAKA